jgi:hypothetical protein
LIEIFCFSIFGTNIVFTIKKELKMKKISLLLFAFLLINSFTKQEDSFTTGEFIKMRIHYGFITAGYATLEVKEATRNNKKVHHIVGKGYTTGLTKAVFKVNDDYQTFVDKESNKPYQFLRKIDEGGYKKHQEGFFDQTKKTVLVKDYKNNTEKTFSVTDEVQDILSAFYYLRNHDEVDQLKVNESISIDMFFDDETTKFKLKYLGKEDISTKFGKVSCMKFRPYVQAGRVFKEEESLTVWVSDDKNKIPISLKASLAVGSLKADIYEYKGLKHTFKAKK